ncbi:sarcosine oxidase subunit gamma [Microbulbifer sp. S227A]|uniref:sarcosine oxidase subunit gamma n=1 Tax=Microbulbifer sp. S227A TaxID=3415131 RepID=UPI003C7BF436
MHDLKPLTPLGAAEPRVERIGPVTLTETVSVALASVAARLGREEAARSTLARVIGAEAPAPSRHGGGTPAAFWTGPDQWMIEAPIATHEDLARQMVDTFGDTASVTEQTDAWCRFDLGGDDLPSVMERLCAVDLRPWQGGEVQRTTIDHLGCFLLCRDPRHLSVIGPRSSAGSLHHALVTACKSAF